MSDSSGPAERLSPPGAPWLPHTPSEFEASYGGAAPWDINRPQRPFEALADAGALRGRVLDVGCGTGEHTLMAAALGLDATGIDFAPTAIERARAKARERGLSARFVLGDALDLGALGEQFDTVLDCGLFHGLADDGRERFARSLAAVVPAGGRYFMLCFSDQVPGTFGPRRVRQDEIRECFAAGWRVESIEDARLDVVFTPDGVHAWLATITRSPAAS